MLLGPPYPTPGVWGFLIGTMYNVCFALSTVYPDMPDHVLAEINAATVNGLALVNQAILRYYNLPSIYDIKPRYHIPRAVRIGRERERWKDVGEVLKDRWGDCKDFVAWRLAELWKQGVDATAESTVTREPTGLVFHTYIRYADGRIEDPARILGMP